MSTIFQDWQVNTNNPKGRIVMASFRLARVIRYNPILRILLGWFYLPFYIVIVEWFLGIEMRWSLELGNNTQLWHGQALVINPGTMIGSNCILRHSTTIGNKGADRRCPSIGNNVDIGANSCILGAVTVGDNVIIGAGSIVVKNIPANSVAVGNPAKVIKSTLL
jgi:putative colanic acid biosynthesis acetyltransferase WcaB